MSGPRSWVLLATTAVMGIYLWMTNMYWHAVATQFLMYFHWCKTPACVNPPNEKSREKIASCDVLDSCENDLSVSEAPSASKMNAASQYRVTCFGRPWQMYIKGTKRIGLPWDKTSAETELDQSMIQSIFSASNNFSANQSIIILTKFKFIPESSKGLKFEPLNLQKQTWGLKFDTLGGSRFISKIQCWCPVYPYMFLNRRSCDANSRSDCSLFFGGRISVSVPWNSLSWPSSRSEPKPLKQTYHFSKKTCLLKWLIVVGFCWGIFFKHAQHAMKVVIHSASDLLVKQDWQLYSNVVCNSVGTASTCRKFSSGSGSPVSTRLHIVLSSSDDVKGFGSHMSLWRRVEANKSCVWVSSM